MTTRKEHIESIVSGIYSLKQKMMASHLKTAKSKILPITPSQWAVVGVLLEKEKASVSEIAKSLGISASASTQLTMGLVQSGYLVRENDANDRRSLILRISNRYKQKIIHMKTKSIEQFMNIFDILNDTELATYAGLHKKIVNRTLNK